MQLRRSGHRAVQGCERDTCLGCHTCEVHSPTTSIQAYPLRTDYIELLATGNRNRQVSMGYTRSLEGEGLQEVDTCHLLEAWHRSLRWPQDIPCQRMGCQSSRTCPGHCPRIRGSQIPRRIRGNPSQRTGGCTRQESPDRRWDYTRGSHIRCRRSDTRVRKAPGAHSGR
jgi:hypothetical protein